MLTIGEDISIHLDMDSPISLPAMENSTDGRLLVDALRLKIMSS